MAGSPLIPQVPAVPTIEETALTLIQWVYAALGLPTDFNIGSIIRTYSEAIGAVDNIEGINAMVQAFQALIYSAYTAFGVFPFPASPSVGTALFSSVTGSPISSSLSISIPLGTLIQANNGTQFATTATAILLSGTVSITAPIQSSTTGLTTNVTSGAISQIVSGLTYPLMVTNLLPTTGGANAEAPAQTLSRLMAYIQSMGLGSPLAVAAAVLGVSYNQEVVAYSSCYESWIFDINNSLPPVTGFTVYIDNGSGSASTNLLNSVSTWLSSGVAVGFVPQGIPLNKGFRPAGVPFSVSAVSPVSASVTVTATAINNALDSTISTSITQAVQNYFTLPFVTDAEYVQLVAAISNVSFGQLSSLSVVMLDGNGNSQTTIPPTPPNLLGWRVVLQNVTVIMST